MSDWAVLSRFWRFLILGPWPDGPLGGLALTAVMTIVGGTTSFAVSLVVGLMRVNRRPLLRYVSTVYVEAVRGLPFIMVLFWFYFLVPRIIGMRVSEFTSVLVAITCFFGAYGAEIVRAGIESVPKLQVEAALSSGFTSTGAMALVVLPQALRNMIPSFATHFISLVKDTSLAWFLGVAELTGASYQVMRGNPAATLPAFLLLFAVYLALCSGLNVLSDKLEKRLAVVGAIG